jgi:phage terminase large subunit-like protein
VYGEALIRLMTTKGLMLITFTPLMGLSDVVLSFMDEDVRGSV